MMKNKHGDIERSILFEHENLKIPSDQVSNKKIAYISNLGLCTRLSG